MNAFGSALVALTLGLSLLTACGSSDGAAVDPIDPGTSIVGDEFPVEQARQDAQAVLGMNEEDLPADVRIGRRGDEVMALTEDYRLGRRTVELDDTDGSGFRVVSVVVELPDGPETFELEPS